MIFFLKLSIIDILFFFNIVIPTSIFIFIKLLNIAILSFLTLCYRIMRFESLSCQRKCKLQLKFRKSWKFLYLIFNLVELISCFLNQEYQYV
ncbi:hypothetical protein Avbf_10428 [Armadillidium vulgare]|nr:hypothetical protein Avbf_10428 [Armadillidium vulgare]